MVLVVAEILGVTNGANSFSLLFGNAKDFAEVSIVVLALFIIRGAFEKSFA